MDLHHSSLSLGETFFALSISMSLFKNLPRLGRPSDHRLSLLSTMVTQLIEHERISTTLAKASALRRVADKAIGLAKEGTQRAWDRARGIIKTERELHKLFTIMAIRYRDREGGYTR